MPGLSVEDTLRIPRRLAWNTWVKKIVKLSRGDYRKTARSESSLEAVKVTLPSLLCFGNGAYTSLHVNLGFSTLCPKSPKLTGMS